MKPEDIEALIALARLDIPTVVPVEPPVPDPVVIAAVITAPEKPPEPVLEVVAPTVLPVEIVTPKPSHSSIEDFMAATGLARGRKKIINQVVYRAYEAWALKPYGKAAFYKEFLKHHTLMRKRTYRYYSLNMAGWQLDLKVKENGEKEKQPGISRT